jgi:sugar lactone lactonase YvrE
MPVLPMTAARVFFDGTFTEPRVAHPEGVAVHQDGSIWCGTEWGDVIRIEADGSRHTRMGTTNGFALGIAFDATGNCFICDLKHAAVFRYDAQSRKVERFAASGILVPNYPIVDEQRGVLYVSDSRGNNNIGPGIFRYDLATGQGGVWSTAPMDFANGMAMAPDGQGLYVVESDRAQLSYVPINPDGSAGAPRVAIAETRNVPDGVALGPDGTIYVSCYEPSRIYRQRPGGALEVLIEDPAATTLAHPTNIALKGDTMYTANLGRWHVTAIELNALRH